MGDEGGVGGRKGGEGGGGGLGEADLTGLSRSLVSSAVLAKLWVEVVDMPRVTSGNRGEAV